MAMLNNQRVILLLNNQMRLMEDHVDIRSSWVSGWQNVKAQAIALNVFGKNFDLQPPLHVEMRKHKLGSLGTLR